MVSRTLPLLNGHLGCTTSGIIAQSSLAQGTMHLPTVPAGHVCWVSIKNESDYKADSSLGPRHVVVAGVAPAQG